MKIQLDKFSLHNWIFHVFENIVNCTMTNGTEVDEADCNKPRSFLFRPIVFTYKNSSKKKK